MTIGDHIIVVAWLSKGYCIANTNNVITFKYAFVSSCLTTPEFISRSKSGYVVQGRHLIQRRCQWGQRWQWWHTGGVTATVVVLPVKNIDATLADTMNRIPGIYLG